LHSRQKTGTGPEICRDYVDSLTTVGLCRNRKCHRSGSLLCRTLTFRRAARCSTFNLAPIRRVIREQGNFYCRLRSIAAIRPATLAASPVNVARGSGDGRIRSCQVLFMLVPKPAQTRSRSRHTARQTHVQANSPNHTGSCKPRINRVCN
jgi:hypothetical protein